MTIKALEKLRRWIGATRKDGLGPMGTNLYELGEIVDAIEAEIAERYMELPLDADGVPVRVADAMVCDTERFTVEGYTSALPDGRGEIMLLGGEFDAQWDASECRHAKLRTVEDVLRDYYQSLAFGSDLPDEPDEEEIEECAADIRELLGVSE